MANGQEKTDQLVEQNGGSEPEEKTTAEKQTDRKEQNGERTVRFSGDFERLQNFHGELLTLQGEGIVEEIPNDVIEFTEAFKDLNYRRYLHRYLQAKQDRGLVNNVPDNIQGFNDTFFPQGTPSTPARAPAPSKQTMDIVNQVVAGDLQALQGLDSVESRRVFEAMNFKERQIINLHQRTVGDDPQASILDLPEEQKQQVREHKSHIDRIDRARNILLENAGTPEQKTAIGKAVDRVSRSVKLGLNTMELSMVSARAMLTDDTEARNRFIDKLNKLGKERSDLQPNPQAFSDIENIEDFGKWAADLAGSQSIIMGSMIVGGVLGGAAGTPLGPWGALAGTVSGAFAVGYPLLAGELYHPLIEQGLDPDDAKRTALIYGAPAAALDVIVPGKAGSMLLGAFGKSYVKRRVSEMLIGAGITSVIEGTTEAAQEAIIMMGEEDALGIEIPAEQKRFRLREGFAGGAFIGGIVGAAERAGRPRASMNEYLDGFIDHIEAADKQASHPVIHAYLVKKIRERAETKPLSKDGKQFLSWLEQDAATRQRPVKEQVNKTDKILVEVFERGEQENYQRLQELNEKDVDRNLSIDESIELTAIVTNFPKLLENLRQQKAPPAPVQPETQELTPDEQLEQLKQRRTNLAASGLGTAQIDQQITELQDQIRQQRRQEAEGELAETPEPAEPTPEIQVDEEVSPGELAGQLRREIDRLTGEMQTLQEQGQDVSEYARSLEQATQRQQEIIQELPRSRRETFRAEGTIEDALGQEVLYGEEIGTLQTDEQGRIVVETDTRIIPVQEAEGDITRPLEQVGLERNVSPTRSMVMLDRETSQFGLETTDPLTGESQVELFEFLTTNQNPEGEIVSATMINEQGDRRTFRSPEILEQILFEKMAGADPAIAPLQAMIDKAYQENPPVVHLDDGDPRLDPVFEKFDRGQQLSREEQSQALQWVSDKVDEIATINPPNANELLTHLEAFENDLITNRPEQPATTRPAPDMEPEAPAAPETTVPESELERPAQQPERQPGEEGPTPAPETPTTPTAQPEAQPEAERTRPEQFETLQEWLDHRRQIYKEEGRRPAEIEKLLETQDTHNWRIAQRQEADLSGDATETVAPEAGDPRATSSNFTRLPLDAIQTDVDRFQLRQSDYSQETVDSIINDFEEGILNLDNIPPVLVWPDGEGNYWMIGGHSRIEAFRRLDQSDIQVQLLEGLSEEQAIQRAREDNTLGTGQTIPELAMLVRDWLSSGMSKAEIDRRSKQLFKNNSRLVQSFAALNPNGKAIQTYMALQRNQSGDRAEAEKFAKWVGEARFRHEQLTDSHENELYNYLLKNDNRHTKTQANYLDFITQAVERNSFMGELDTSQPLNINQLRPLSEVEQQFNQQLEEAKKELSDAQKALQRKISEIERRRSAGEEIDQSVADAALASLTEDVKVAERKLLSLRQKEMEVEKANRDQGSLFGSQDNDAAPEVSNVRAAPVRNERFGIDSNVNAGRVEISAETPQGAALLASNDIPYDENTKRFLVTIEEAEQVQEMIQGYNEASQNRFYSLFAPVEGTQEIKAPAEFVENPAETKQGKKLIKQIKDDEGGDRIGVRSIVEFLNDVVGVELRVGDTQLSKRYPARYESLPHIVRSKVAAWMYNFHEAGHAMSTNLRSVDRNWWNSVSEALEALTHGVGEHASAKTAEEGFAEWTRLFIVNPRALPAELTQRIQEKIQQVSPKQMKGLRDAHRAFHAHYQRNPEARFWSYSTDLFKQGDTFEGFRDMWHQALFSGMSIEQALERVEAKTFKSISKLSEQHINNFLEAWDSGTVEGVKGLMKLGKEKTKAIQRAREFEKSFQDSPADSKVALQSYIRAPLDTHFAIHGDKRFKREGIKIRWFSEKSFDQMFTDQVRSQLEEAGYNIPEAKAKFGHDVYLFDKSISAIKEETVGRDNWNEFQKYGFMRESINRFDNKGHRYPGITDDGTRPGQLRSRIKELEAKHPEWKQAFQELNDYFDALALLGYISGEKTVTDLQNIKKGIDSYWPMPRRMQLARGGVGISRGRPQGSVRHTTKDGSQRPLADLDEAIELYTRRAIQSYYWNNVMLSVRNLARKMETQKDLPVEARQAVNRFMVPLELDVERIGALKPEEGKQVIAEWLNAQLLEQKMLANPGADPEMIVLDPAEQISPDEIEVSWQDKPLWRATEPTAVKLVAPFENGKRVFYEVNDPILFDFFTHSKQPSDAIKAVFDVVNPMTEAWKRPLTHNIIFSTWQLVSRDIPQSMLMGQGWRSYIPGWYAGMGMMNRLVGRSELLQKAGFEYYPEAIEAGALLTKAFSALTSDAHRSIVDNFLDVMKEGIMIPGWEEMTSAERRRVAPGQIMASTLKPVEVGLYVTGQRNLSIAMESIPREGVFIQMIKDGKSPAAAQEMYDKLIGNFGSYPGNADILAMYRMAGFLNPGVQVFYQHYQKLFNHDPAVAAHSWAVKIPFIMASYGTYAAINWLLTDEEDRKRMRERRDDNRMRYMNWFGRARIPFDYGITGVAQSVGWNMVEERLLDDPIGSNAYARAVLQRAVDLPVNPSAFVQPMIKTVGELNIGQSGYSFFWNREIVPPWMAETYKFNPEMQTFSTTPDFYNVLGEKLKVSPIKVQYFVRNALTNQMDEAIGAYSNVARGQEIRELADIPFIGRAFEAEPRGFRSQSVINVTEIETKYQALMNQYSKLVENQVTGPEMEDLRNQMSELQNVTGIMAYIERKQRFVNAERKKPDPDQDHIKRLEREMTEAAREWFERNPEHLRKLKGRN